MSNTATATKTCHFCEIQLVADFASDDYTGSMNAPHWTGTEYVRVDTCNGCAGEVVHSAPSKPRTRQPRQVVASDYNMLCNFMGTGHKKGRK